MLRCCAFGEARAEGFVEVRPDGALGVGAGERVAGAALGDELLLAEDQVGVVGALHRAAGGEQGERREQHRDGERTRTPRRVLRPGSPASGRACLEIISERNTIRTGGRPDARSGAPRRGVSGRSQDVQFAARRGDHAARDPLPGPALAGRRDEPGARVRAQLRGRPSASRVRRSARARTALSSIGNESHAAACAGTARGEHVAHLGQPRMRGADRQHAAGGGLRGDHPEGLGEGARHDQRLRTRAAARRAPRAPGGPLSTTLSPSARRGRQIALALAPREDSSRKASRWRSGRRLAADSSSSARPARAISPARSMSPAPERRSRALAARSGRHRSRRARAARAGRARSTSGQAASSRSTPLLTISLPTKATSTSRSGSSAASAPRRPPGVAREGAVGPSPARAPRARRCAAARASARTPAARRRRLARREALRRPRPAGPGACAPAAPARRAPAHRLCGGVAGAHEHRVRRREALAREAEEALGFAA